LCYTGALGAYVSRGEQCPLESTFDIVSEFDRRSWPTLVDQTQRDVRTRYDLKDSNTELVLGEKELTITSDAELHLAAVRDIFETKALRRNLSLKIFNGAQSRRSADARAPSRRAPAGHPR